MTTEPEQVPLRARGWGIPVLMAIGCLIAVLAIGGLISTISDRKPPAKTVTYVVPPGTAQKQALGKTVTIMPAEVKLNIGDTLIVRNDDESTVTVGPFTARAGETITQRFQRAQTLVGECNLSETGSVKIIVS